MRNAQHDPDQQAFMRMLQSGREEAIRSQAGRTIEADLNCDVEEMDTDRILSAIDASDSDVQATERLYAEREPAIWNAIRRRQKNRWRRQLPQRVAAIAAVLFVVFGIASFQAARAFNWDFFIQLMAPIAERFGLSTGADSVSLLSSEASDVEIVQERVDMGSEEDTDIYLELSEVPVDYDGYQVVTEDIPERFYFVEATHYNSEIVDEFVVLYDDGAGDLCIKVHVYRNTGTVAGPIFEKDSGDGSIQTIAGCAVSMTKNKDVLVAKWSVGLAYYDVWGTIDDDEMRKIIESLMRG